MKCLICKKGETQIGKVTVTLDRGGATFVVKNVPAQVCQNCGEEYVDNLQAKKLETIWAVEKLMRDDVLCMERSLNYDGKMFFLRFPKELTKNWHKGGNACIKMIDTKRLIVEIK